MIPSGEYRFSSCFYHYVYGLISINNNNGYIIYNGEYRNKQKLYFDIIDGDMQNDYLCIFKESTFTIKIHLFYDMKGGTYEIENPMDRGNINFLN